MKDVNKANTEKSAPRFEFRSFGQDFSNAASLMARLSIPVPRHLWERHSDEIYIMSRANNENNTKIRNSTIDIKTHVQTVEGFEQWNPLIKAEFPISREILLTDVFPAFQVEPEPLSATTYTRNQFKELVNSHPDLQGVHVHKQRFAYTVNNTLCETGIILINGARVSTINCESTDLDALKKTIIELELEGVENINYLQAIKRVIGMIDKPLAN